MTYNVHKCIGWVDRRCRPERAIASVAQYQPDVLLLQEVCSESANDGGRPQIELFAESLGFRHVAFQRNHRSRFGLYGNAILSHYPLDAVRDIELTLPLKKRRRALMAKCHARAAAHMRTVTIFNVHLGLAGFERRFQVRRLLAESLIDTTARAHAVIAAGDFNDAWGRLERRLLRPAGFRPAAVRAKTFPAFQPIQALDRIYYRGQLELVRCFVARSRVARLASDHLPLVAEFRFR